MSKKRFVKYALLSTGTVCLGLGIAGVFLPLVPTTPFLLAAAALYARGSEKFYIWLMENRWFGSYIKDYRKRKGLPLKIKIGTIIILWVTITCSAVFATDLLWLRLLLLAIAIGVTTHIVCLKTLKK